MVIVLEGEELRLSTTLITRDNLNYEFSVHWVNVDENLTKD
jgi:hypothetical protein